MFKEFLVLLRLAHTVGDFYAQSDAISNKKDEKIIWLFFHSFLYWAITMGLFVLVKSKAVFVFGSLSAFVHFIIDFVKSVYVRRKNKKGEIEQAKLRDIFFIDQLLHLISIIFIAYLFIFFGNILIVNENLLNLFTTIGISKTLTLSWITMVLIVHKPTNIAISRILAIYRPIILEEKLEDRKAGRLIGTLERIIIVILIDLKQYSAIGLVLTAKSVARYDKITKDPYFSEYYLIGTLLSTLCAIGISLLLKI